MRLEHHLVGGYVRYISPHIIIIIINCSTYMELGHPAPCKVSLSGLYSTESINIQQTLLLEFEWFGVVRVNVVAAVVDVFAVVDALPQLFQTAAATAA